MLLPFFIPHTCSCRRLFNALLVCKVKKICTVLSSWCWLVARRRCSRRTEQKSWCRCPHPTLRRQKGPCQHRSMWSSVSRPSASKAVWRQRSPALMPTCWRIEPGAFTPRKRPGVFTPRKRIRRRSTEGDESERAKRIDVQKLGEVRGIVRTKR